MATSAAQIAKTGKFGDLRRRLVFLLLALVVYRIGAHIPVPGIDPAQLQQLSPLRSQKSRKEPDMAQTSDRISKIAGRYAGITTNELLAVTSTPALREQTAGDIRSMAASLLRQDETTGLRRLLRKVIGR